MSDRRQEDYDRDFVAMVSGLEMAPLTSEPSSPADPRDLPQPPEPPDLRVGRSEVIDPRPAARDYFNLSQSLDDAEPDEPAPSEYQPPPLPPMRAPRGVSAVGWGCAAYVLLALILTVIGVRLPGWAGWLAIVAFVAAILIGWRSLPRHRNPEDGDGAVV